MLRVEPWSLPQYTKSHLRWGFAALLSALVFALDQGAGGMPYFRDRMYYFWPLYEACRSAVAEGQVPLWNPFVNCGQPLLATWQAAVASPLTLPFLVFPFDTAMRLFWILALGLAAAGMYALGLRVGLSPFGAAVAAVVYAGAGPLRTLGEWPNIIQSLAYLPALLVVLTDLGRGRRGALVATALLSTLMILSGQPRQLLVVGVTSLAWIIALRINNQLKERLWLPLAGAAALACAIAGLQLLPSVELFWYSGRRSYGVSLSTIRESFLHSLDLLTTLSAKIFGDEHRYFGPNRLLVPNLYLGAMGLWLTGIGLALNQKRRFGSGPTRRRVSPDRGEQTGPGGLVRIFALIALPAGLVLALSEPLYHAVTDLLGGAQLLRYMGHMVLSALPAVALLGGFGAQQLIEGVAAGTGRKPEQGAIHRWVVGWPCLVLGLTLALWSPLGAQLAGWLEIPPDVRNGPYLQALRMDLGLTAGILATGALLVRTTWRSRPALLLILLAVDFLMALHGYEAKAPRAQFTKPRVLSQYPLHAGRLFSPSWKTQVYTDPEVPMLDHYQARYWVLSPNTPLLWKIHNVIGYEPFRLAAHQELFGPWKEDLPSLRDSLFLAGARWMIGPIAHPPEGWIKRREILPGWAVWEHPAPRPVATVVPRVAVHVPWRALTDIALCGEAAIQHEGWNDLLLETRTASRALLCVAIPWVPGWHARVNGSRSPLTRAGNMFLATPVPAGLSRVSLVYSPLSFKLGLWLSTLALAGSAGYGILLALNARGRREYGLAVIPAPSPGRRGFARS